MQAYKYKGCDPFGKKVEGEIQASTMDEAERRIAAQDITVIAILPASARRTRAVQREEEASEKAIAPRRTVSDADAAVVLKNLSVMAETGVPFVEALDAVITSARTPVIERCLQSVKAEVIGGKALSMALRSVPQMFPPLVADMVKVAEEGGRLDHALRTGGLYLERAADLRKRVFNSMMYPMVMAAVSALTVIIMVVFVMPRFAEIFVKMQAEIPWTTRALMSLGDLIRNNPWYTLAGLVAFGFLARALLRTDTARRWVPEILLRVPLLGELLRKLALSRAFQSIATLIQSNVSLMSALEHGAKVAGNASIAKSLMDSREMVEHGTSFSEALEETNAFPKMLVQVVRVGERSGRLGPLLETTAASLEEDMDARLKALVSIVEPLMIVVMGLIVGTITVSIIGPIYSVVQNVK